MVPRNERRTKMIHIHPYSLIQWWNTREGPRMSVSRNGIPKPWESHCVNSTMNGVAHTTFKNVLDGGCRFSLVRKRDNLSSVPIIRYDRFNGSIRNMCC